MGRLKSEVAMSETQVQRGQWQSRLGFIMAAAGSAIGLGNIVHQMPRNVYDFIIWLNRHESSITKVHQNLKL